MLSPKRVIQACVLATGLAGIVAEYSLSTLASYLLGNTLYQWALTISVFLFAMGLGSRVTRFVTRRLAEAFITAEMALSLVIAVAVPICYTMAGWPEWTEATIYSFTLLTGLLIGTEIPLIVRLNSEYEELSLNLSNVLEKDYIGALLGGLFFAFVGLPKLGIVYMPLILGAVNFSVAMLFIAVFRHRLNLKVWGPAAGTVTAAFLLLAITVQPIVRFAEQRRFKDVVIYDEQTPYQKIVMTRWHNDIWLYLDGHEQFSTYDEARYHESLVHPPLLAAEQRRDILILGGGDGLAAREVLKYPDVEHLTIVELDPAMTRLAKEHPLLNSANVGALNDPRVEVINTDAHQFIQRTDRMWDVILADFPDPRAPALERLYSVEFYRLCRERIRPGGVMATQATSPIFAKEAFWCIYKTMESAGWQAAGWHAHVPSLGEWGWVMGGGLDHRALLARLAAESKRLPQTRFLTPEVLRSLFVFSPEDRLELANLRVNAEIRPILNEYYRKGDWALF